MKLQGHPNPGAASFAQQMQWLQDARKKIAEDRKNRERKRTNRLINKALAE